MKVDFLAEAAASQDTLISLRRQLHRTAGAGFDIPETLSKPDIRLFPFLPV